MIFLYSFARADAMKDHLFTDDVAICFALNKKRAIKKFLKLYADIEEYEVKKVRFNICKIAILTDY